MRPIVTTQTANELVPPVGMWKLGGFAVNRDGVVDMGASGWGNISPVYVPTGTPQAALRLRP